MIQIVGRNTQMLTFKRRKYQCFCVGIKDILCVYMEWWLHLLRSREEHVSYQRAMFTRLYFFFSFMAKKLYCFSIFLHDQYCYQAILRNTFTTGFFLEFAIFDFMAVKKVEKSRKFRHNMFHEKRCSITFISPCNCNCKIK